jgi:hypothetical protein
MSYADTNIEDDPMSRLVDAEQNKKSKFMQAQDADTEKSANVDFRLGVALRCMQKIQAKIASNARDARDARDASRAIDASGDDLSGTSSDDLSGANRAIGASGTSSTMPQETIKFVPDTYTKRLIYQIDKPDDLFSIKVNTIMSRAFPTAIKPGMSNQKKIESLLHYSGYLVLKIEEIDNPSQNIRFEAEKFASGIEESCIVFHGTSENNIHEILSKGFDFRKFERGKYGVGYYSSGSSWEALKYAKPNEQDKIQFLIVFEYLKGSTAIGSNGQTDFGTNLTLTDETGKILCAKNHTQFNPKYVIAMQYDMNNVLTRLQNSTVENFHKVIYDMIISKKSAAAAATMATAATIAGSFLASSSSATASSSSATASSSSATASSSSATASSSSATTGPSSATTGPSSAVNTRQKHEVLDSLLIDKQKIEKGTKVMVIDTFKPNTFYFTKGYEGVVMKIVKKYNKYIYVEISDPKIKEQVINANKMLKTKNEFPFTNDQEESWIVLPPRYIKMISPPAATSGTSAVGGASGASSAAAGRTSAVGSGASTATSAIATATTATTSVAILEAATVAALAARSTYVADLQKLATAKSSATTTGPAATTTTGPVSVIKSGLRRELAIIIPDTDSQPPITNKRCIDLVNENNEASAGANTRDSTGTSDGESTGASKKKKL